MKKLFNFCLLLASLVGYLEWGKDNFAFLFQVEYELLFGNKDSQNFLHPFVLLPLLGQLLLIITLFQKTPKRALTYTALASLSLLMLFICFIGALTLNFKVLLSTMPFIITGILILRYNRRGKRGNGVA